jgi:predicted DNA-binding transcriptional regulator AlpA
MTQNASLERRGIELFTRADVAKFLKIAISHVDLIPERELPRVHIGKSIRFRLSSLEEFIEMKETKKGG